MRRERPARRVPSRPVYARSWSATSVCGSTGPTPATHADAQAPTTFLLRSDRAATRTAPSCLVAGSAAYHDATLDALLRSVGSGLLAGAYATDARGLRV